MTTPIVSAPLLWLGALALNATDANGVDWIATDLAGWSGSPAGTLAVTQREADHGGWGGGSWLGPRELTLSGYVAGPTRGAMIAALDQLNAAASLSATPLRVLEDGGLDRTIQVRRNGELVSTVTGIGTQFSLPLVAEDPRKYSSTAHTGVCSLPSVVGGLTWPLTFPATFDAVVSAGSIPVGNAGTIGSRPLLQITGAVQQPVVTLQRPDGTIQQLIINTTLGQGDTLEIDCDAHTAILNGSAGRRGAIAGTWPEIPPGSMCALNFNGAASGTGQLSATWYDAWM